MANLHWKIGDTAPVQAQLGTALDGDDIEVKIYAYGVRDSVLATPSATIDDSVKGIIAVTPDAALPAGRYTAEAVITGAQGIRTTLSLTLVVGDIDQDIYPPDVATPIGQMRMLIGDVTYAADADDVFSYTYFTDAELQNFYKASGESIKRGVASAIKQLALNAALTGISIKADDLAIDNRTRGTSLLEIANSYAAEADSEDADEMAGTFILVSSPTTGRRARTPHIYQPAVDTGYGEGGYGQ